MPKITFEITFDQQLEVENVCTEEGKSFSDYFMGLHKQHLQDTRKYTKAEVESMMRERKNSLPQPEEEQDLDGKYDFVPPSASKRGRPSKKNVDK